MIHRHKLGWFAGSLLCLILPPLTARAKPETRQDLRAAITELAKSVKVVVEREGQTAVRVGRFTPLGLDDANSGDGISALVAEALGRLVNPTATLEVQGLYGFIEDDSGTGIKFIKIKVKLFDTKTLEDKKVFLPLEAQVRSNADIARLLNHTGSLDPDGSYEERNKEIQKDQNPKNRGVFIHGDSKSLISSSQESPFAVEVVVGGKPRAAQEDKGLAYVQVDKDEIYHVHIVNKAPQEIAVTLQVDGLDMFTFSDDRKDGKPRFSHWIVPAARDGKPGETILRGWHKTADPKRKDNFLQFLVTENGKGAASKFPTISQGKVGVITVSFAFSYPKGTSRSAGSETGFGPPVEVKQAVFVRDIAPAHDFVTVRYRR